MTRQPTSPALPTEEQVQAGRETYAEWLSDDTPAIDLVRSIYLAMQAKAPATSVGGVEGIVRDELFDASISPEEGVDFEVWQAGYDAALNQVLERATALSQSSSPAEVGPK